MTFREAKERGDRSAVADKLFAWIAPVFVLLAIAWCVYACIDFCGAIILLFILAFFAAIILVVLFAAAGVADTVADMLT